MIRITYLAHFLAIAAPAYAQTDEEIAARLTPAVHQCESAPENGGTMQQAICYGYEAARQDRQLNATWARVIARLPLARRVALRQSERRWIRRRDEDCLIESEEQGRNFSSTAKYMYNVCFANASIRRTIWLEHFR